MVNKAIALLSPDDAQLITLFYKGEQSLEEIGRVIWYRTQYGKSKIAPCKTKTERKKWKHICTGSEGSEELICKCANLKIKANTDHKDAK